MNPDRASQRADDLQRRLRARLDELDRELQVASQPPVVVGAALVLPAGLLAQQEAEGKAQAAAARAVDTTSVERRAVDAVLAGELHAGCVAVEMPHNHPGYDIRSVAPDGRITFIEVKGRIAGADTFTVTQNELRFAANIPDAYLLALVEVAPDGPEGDQVRYLRQPYGGEVRLPFDTTSTNLGWVAYWARATSDREL